MRRIWRLAIAGVFLVLWTGLTPASGAVLIALVIGFLAGATGKEASGDR